MQVRITLINHPFCKALEFGSTNLKLYAWTSIPSLGQPSFGCRFFFSVCTDGLKGPQNLLNCGNDYYFYNFLRRPAQIGG